MDLTAQLRVDVELDQISFVAAKAISFRRQLQDIPVMILYNTSYHEGHNWQQLYRQILRDTCALNSKS